MENKRKALGKGLEQLFSNESLYVDPIEEIIETTPKENVVEIKIKELRSNPYQPRRTFDQEKLVELANSIKEYGVLEPIIVTKSVKGYEIVAGERRTKACELIGKETIPAIVKDFTDNEMMEIALLENIQREDLTAIEEAEAYAGLIKALNITQEELAKKIGKSRTHVTNMLGILRLPQEIKNDILNGYISMGHARVLSKLEDKAKIVELANKVVENGLTVRDLEDLSNDEKLERKNKIIKKTTSSEYKYVEDMLRDKLDTKVKINDKKITIQFTNNADLNRILEIIDVKE